MKITMLEKVNDKREEGTRSAVLIGMESFLIMVGKDAAGSLQVSIFRRVEDRPGRLRNVHHKELWRVAVLERT